MRTAPLLAMACALPLLLSACGSAAESADSGSTAGEVAVAASDTACELATTDAPAGPVTFTVTNTGSQTTEFYVYAADGQTIVGEVENIGPGLARDLSLALEPGDYVTACKPGMAGEGIRGQFSVSESG